MAVARGRRLAEWSLGLRGFGYDVLARRKGAWRADRE